VFFCFFNGTQVKGAYQVESVPMTVKQWRAFCTQLLLCEEKESKPFHRKGEHKLGGRGQGIAPTMDGLRMPVRVWWQVPSEGEHKVGGRAQGIANTVSDGRVLCHSLKKDAECLPLLPLLPLLQFDQ
jgi:hypothetical protein